LLETKVSVIPTQQAASRLLTVVIEFLNYHKQQLDQRQTLNS